MKTKSFLLGAVILSISATLFSSCNATSANQSNTFKVYGNCGMCEKTIEGSLINTDGIAKADWDKKTKLMVVEFDSTKINLNTIKSKISEVGYDMDNVTAEDSVYSELPMCCQYDRPGLKNEEQKNNNLNTDTNSVQTNH